MNIRLIHCDWEDNIYKPVTLIELKKYVEKRTKEPFCLVYLNNEGEMCEIKSEKQLSDAQSLMKSSFQFLLVIMVENRQRYLKYSKSLPSIEPEPPSIVFFEPIYSFTLISINEIQKNQPILQYRTYRQKWTIKNTGDVAWKEIKLKNCSLLLEVKDYKIPDLKPDEEGDVSVLFKFSRYQSDEKVLKEELKLISSTGFVFGPSLTIQVIVKRFPEVEKLMEFLENSPDEIVDALEKFNGSIDEAADFLLNQ